MNKIVIPRSLWYQTDKGRQKLNQTDLLSKAESMIILGDAGMGKSTLLKQISESPDYEYCSARKLINSLNPRKIIGNSRVLVIDALDEVSADKNGDSIDSILAKLEELGYPRFMLSCREADWHSATNKSLVNEHYSSKPIELHLNAFNDSEILEYLTAKHGIDKAELLIQHFQSRGLIDLLGNPQTLSMLSEVSQMEDLPENKAEIYKAAVDNLAVEHNDSKESGQLSKNTVLDITGAVFATLILTGNEVIARKAIANLQLGELSFTDLDIFLDVDKLCRAVSSRLFSSVGNDCFSYLHRSIGEYLGARWLAKQVGIGPRKKRRLLTLFQSNGAVPSSLRGIHAWLAQYPNFFDDIIKSDPMGIIEYGDADNLNVNQGKLLLDHLVILANENPRFKGWKSYSARGLSQKELIPDISLLITNKDVEFSLRMLLLEILKGSVSDHSIIVPLHTLIMDKTEIFAIRSEAINVLMGLDNKVDEFIAKLYKLEDEESLRLAVELMGSLSYLNISNTLIVDLVIDYAVINDHSFNKFYALQRRLPDNRLAEILDVLAIKISSQGKWYERSGNDDISEFTCSLLVRLIKNTDITIEKLWYWLDKIQPRMEYSSDVSKELKELIYSNDAIRLELYKLVLFESDSNETLWKKKCNLQESLGHIWTLSRSQDELIQNMKIVSYSSDFLTLNTFSLTRLR